MPARAGERATSKESPHAKEENPELRKVARALRSFVKTTVPGVKETVNVFGTSLRDPGGLLEGTGKNIRHVKLRTVEDLNRNGLKRLMQAAAQVKGKAPMKGMRGK